MYIAKWTMAVALLGFSPYILAMEGPYEQLQVPQCLASKITMAHKVLAQNRQFKIIELKAKEVDQLALLADKVNCGRFVNSSHQFKAKNISLTKQELAQEILKKTLFTSPAVPASYQIKHRQEVKTLQKEVIADNIWQTLTHLSAYHNRSATEETGLEAAQWLQANFESMALEYGRTDTNSFFVNTSWYKQPSLVTVIGKDKKRSAIVLGAHMDTLSGHMPGADDDGSGSASLMEAARVLLASKLDFKHPIYIIWYAAEERGLVGSQYVVQHFKEHTIPVKAVMQLDMTGYRKHHEDSTLWLYTDYTDKKLNDYMAKLIETYLQVPVAYSSCGYGCSDHASWTAQNIPATFPCESSFKEENPYIHTVADTMEWVSLDHMTEFTKLALAFAVELGSE